MVSHWQKGKNKPRKGLYGKLTKLNVKPCNVNLL